MGRIADDDLAVLDDYAHRLAAIVAADDGDLDEFLDTSHGYHCTSSGSAAARSCVDTYRALGISALWRRAIDGQDWRTQFDVAHHAALTAGLPRRRRRRGPASSSSSTPSRSAGSSAT